jgi:hypothetical protein
MSSFRIGWLGLIYCVSDGLLADIGIGLAGTTRNRSMGTTGSTPDSRSLTDFLGPRGRILNMLRRRGVGGSWKTLWR